MHINEEHLWDSRCSIENIERLAVSLGIVVNDRARAAWGNEWRGWLIQRTADAMRADNVRAIAERKRERETGYVVTDRRSGR